MFHPPEREGLAVELWETLRVTHRGVPDCIGYQTFGSSKTGALAAARDALHGWLEAGLLVGEVPPRPRARKGEPVTVERVASALGLRVDVTLGAA